MKFKYFLILLFLLFACNSPESRFMISRPELLSGFDKRNYSEEEKSELNKIMEKIKREFEKFNPEFLIQELSIKIIFDKNEWTKNITVNVHDENTFGTEAVSPALRINDNLLKVDYCWFYTENCAVPQDVIVKSIDTIYNFSSY